ncbi:MAG: hypothetical protein IK118_00525, partial [Clostridia bacterium]|nr:hypothetical protein [Clostridia bacterium]
MDKLSEIEGRDLLSLDESELESTIVSLGHPRYRAGQIRRHLLAGVGDFAEMSDLPNALRADLAG